MRGKQHINYKFGSNLAQDTSRRGWFSLPTVHSVPSLHTRSNQLLPQGNKYWNKAARGAQRDVVHFGLTNNALV
jgi:hypothetical protein